MLGWWLYICDMNANELRIGNWVHSKPHKSNIQFNFLVQYFDSDVFDANNYAPIPITEEWLDKFGFEKKSSHAYYYNEPIRIDVFGCEFMVRFRAELDDYNLRLVELKNSKVKYVHQLQNLYFALTGEELSIT